MDPDGKPADRSVTVADLWHFYDEHAAQARQHESMRAAVTSTLAAIAAAVVGLAGVGGLTLADIPAGLIVVTLSSLGVALCIKHYERNRMHTKVMSEVRDEIDRLQANPHVHAKTTADLRSMAKKKHEGSFLVFKKFRSSTASRPVSWACRVRLHLLWLGLPACIGIIGILVILLSIVGVESG